MRVDLYTKGVLTVIAACMVYVSMGMPPVLQTAQAQTPIQGLIQPLPEAPIQPLPREPLRNPFFGPRVQAFPPPAKVLSGDDVGVRIQRLSDGVPIGTMVVRIDGRWVDVDTDGGVQLVPLTH